MLAKVNTSIFIREISIQGCGDMELSPAAMSWEAGYIVEGLAVCLSAWLTKKNSTSHSHLHGDVLTPAPLYWCMPY